MSRCGFWGWLFEPWEVITVAFFSRGMTRWKPSLKNVICLRTFLEQYKNHAIQNQAHSPRRAIEGACVFSLPYLWCKQSEEFDTLASGVWFIMIPMLHGWPNDWLSHWSWEPEMGMMDWATPAAACGKSDFVQMSYFKQPLLPIPWWPYISGSRVPSDSLMKPLTFPTSYPPTLPSVFLSLFLFLCSFPSSLSPFGHMSPLSVFSSSGLFLKVHCYLVGTWQEEGTRSIKILLKHGMKSKSPLSISQGLRIISTLVLAGGIT